MHRRPRSLGVVLFFLGTSAACGTVDLSKTLQVVDVQSGYYDSGVKDGKNYLRPQITFRLKNIAAEPINSVGLTIAFWRDGTDGEWDSVLHQGIGSSELAPGMATEPITARLHVGYTLEGARADFFTNSLFRDVTAKIFAKRSGKIFRMGEYKLEHLIIPTEPRDAPRP
jgi:hypothetical protein